MFTKELEMALLNKSIDVAVHSLKDMSATMPEGFTIAAVLEREDPCDVLVSRSGATLAELPSGAVVGTSSPRREALVRALRPDLAVTGVRGNVGTRIRKMQDGQYDALVLAAAGLVRLGRESEATERLDPLQFIPAVGQGAIALQSRLDDAGLLGMLTALDHSETRAAVTAERAFLRAMGGGCRTPMGAYGTSCGTDGSACPAWRRALMASRAFARRSRELRRRRRRWATRWRGGCWRTGRRSC